MKNGASTTEAGHSGVVLEREAGDVGDLAISSAGLLATTRKVAFRIEELLSARFARCHSSQRFRYFTPCYFPFLSNINENHLLMWKGLQKIMSATRSFCSSTVICCLSRLRTAVCFKLEQYFEIFRHAQARARYKILFLDDWLLCNSYFMRYLTCNYFLS